MASAGETVRLREWLASRTPAPPDVLRKKLDGIAGDEACYAAELPSRFLAHAEVILAEIGDDRSYATDLLAADALISYAMEAAADQRADVESIALTAMNQVAGIVSA